MEFQEISKYLFGAIISLALWFIKGIIKELNERKANEIIIKDKVYKNFWNVEDIKKDVVEIKSVQLAHREMIDNNGKDINTIIATHNTSSCGKQSRIQGVHNG